MKRYQQASRRQNEDKETFYKTQILPDIDRRPEDAIITIETPDRLDRLAFRFYDDSKLWWVLAAANNLGRGDWAVPAGTRLRVPQNLSEISSEIRTTNRNR